MFNAESECAIFNDQFLMLSWRVRNESMFNAKLKYSEPPELVPTLGS